MGIPNNLTWHLRNLYAGQEATGKPGMQQFMGSQRVGHDLATEQRRFLLEVL